MPDYRSTLYESYVTTQVSNAGGASALADLGSRAPYLKALIKRHFPAERTSVVVDLGCGHGALLHFAQKAGYKNSSGVDISQEQVDLAQELGVKGVTRGNVIDALAEMPDSSVDVVIAFDVLEHLSKDELMGFVRHIHRTLKGAGRFISHVPNAESPFFGAIRYGDFTHEQAFTATSIRQILLAHGFTSVHCYEDEPIPHGLKSLTRLLLWKVIRTLLAAVITVETGSRKGWLFSQNLLAIAVKRTENNQ